MPTGIKKNMKTNFLLHPKRHVSQRDGSEDPDPHQNATDPQTGFPGVPYLLDNLFYFP